MVKHNVVERAAKKILAHWDGWDGAAQSIAQCEQNPDAWTGEMLIHLEYIIQNAIDEAKFWESQNA